MDAILESSFIELPGLLVLRLMSRCNQKCIFCMVGSELQSSTDIDYETASSRILAQPPGTRIEFFGGEPTMYPRFVDLVRLALTHGFPCSIATNGRIFSNEKYTQTIAALGVEKLYIRTSLYGDTAELHDYYTASPGSYRQTVRGISNIIRAGLLCQVNVVIMSRNYARLGVITELVHTLGVPRIKYGNLIDVGTCTPHAVPLWQVRPHLEQAISLAEQLGLVVTVEKTPACIANCRLDLMSTERLIGGWSRVFDAGGVCDECLVRRWCEGVDPDYAALYGFAGLHPVYTMPRSILKGSVDCEDKPEFLKYHCVELSGNTPDEQELSNLYILLQKVKSQLGELVVIPQRYLDN